jgi:hypothetical protein
MNQIEERFSVAGKNFISKKWPTRSKAFRNLPIIGKHFAVPISMIMASRSEDELQEKIPTALYMLFEQLEDSDSTVLIDTILEDVTINDIANGLGYRKLDVDNDIDDIADLLDLLALVLRQQYGKLIEGKSFGNLLQVMIPLAQATA